MKAVCAILLAAGVTYAACIAAGRLLTRLLRLNLSWFLTFITGAAVVSTSVFFITAAGLAHTGEFVALAALLVICGVSGTGPRPAAASQAARGSVSVLPDIPRPWQIAFWTIYTIFGLIYLVQAMAPEASPDGVSYHAGLVTRYLQEHQFPDLTTDFFVGFPAAIEMLFLLAFSIGKHSAAAMVEFLFLLSLPFGMIAWARRKGHPVAGVAGALLFFVTPVVGRDGTVAYVDVAVAAIAFALFQVLDLWRERPSLRLAGMAGLMAGFGFASKYTQAAGVLYGAAMIAWWSRGRWRQLVKSVAVFALCSALMIAPWLVKNALILDNPFAPLLNRWFPNPYFHASTEAEVIERGRKLTDLSAFGLPVELALRGARVEGLVGPVLLILPLAMLALVYPAGRQLLLAGAVFSLPWLANVSARFLIAPLVFFLLALAMAVVRFRGAAPALVGLAAIACWPPMVRQYAPQAWKIEEIPWHAALRLIPEESYLRAKIPDYAIGLRIRQYVPEGAQVLTRNAANLAYQPRELVTAWHSAFGTRMFAYLDQAMNPGHRPTRRVSFRFGERAVKRIRLVLDDCGNRLWAVAEMRVFLGDAEIMRQPGWRLKAWPNPWDVRDAFDGSPITVWNAREYRPASAFVGIDFPVEQKLDWVTADLPRDLGGCHCHLEGITGAHGEAEDAPYPERYRRAAIEELESNRIRWLVMRDDEPLTADLLERAGQWGVTPIAREGQFRLFRLD